MQPFNEQLRYDYDLNSDSIVFDVGGYEGMFAANIHHKYACNVSIFEPLEEYYFKCLHILSVMPVFKVYKRGLGGSTRTDIIHKEGDRTGIFAQGETETIDVWDIKEAVGDKKLDLIKINIEGMEYELLERVIECNLQSQLKNIQVQFHKIGDNYEERYKKIRAELLKTHHLTYDYPFVWQNFTLNK